MVRNIIHIGALIENTILLTAYPLRKTSASFNEAEFIKIGNGYFSNRFGNLTIASHCSPALPDRKPKRKESSFKGDMVHKRKMESFQASNKVCC